MNNVNIGTRSFSGAYYSNEIQLGIDARWYISFMILDWNGVSSCFNFYHIGGTNTITFFSDGPQTIDKIWIRAVYLL